jgi:hypothetical protein
MDCQHFKVGDRVLVLGGRHTDVPGNVLRIEPDPKRLGQDTITVGLAGDGSQKIVLSGAAGLA